MPILAKQLRMRSTTLPSSPIAVRRVAMALANACALAAGSDTLHYATAGLRVSTRRNKLGLDPTPASNLGEIEALSESPAAFAVVSGPPSRRRRLNEYWKSPSLVSRTIG